MSLASLIKTTELSADEKSSIESGGKFALLPAGWYEGTVAKVEVIDFSSKDESPYKQQGYKALNVQLRILDGSPTGAKRVFFLRVPLFQRHLPSAKNPQGAVASTYFDFFIALGFTKEQVATANVSIDQASLGGKRIALRLVQKDPDNWNTEKFNEVANVRAPQPLPGVAEPGASAVGSAFTPSESSPWAQGDSQLQAAAEGKGAF